MEPEAKSFLLPDVVQLSQGASVVLEDVDILTSDSVVEEYIDFAKSSLEKDTYEVGGEGGDGGAKDWVGLSCWCGMCRSWSFQSLHPCYNTL